MPPVAPLHHRDQPESRGCSRPRWVPSSAVTS